MTQPLDDDAQHAVQIIDQAEEAWFILQGMARAQTRPHGPKVDTSNAPAAPLNLTSKPPRPGSLTRFRPVGLLCFPSGPLGVR